MDRDEKILKQTTEQYANIGRFIQEFELVVQALRFLPAIFLPRGNGNMQDLVNIILHHSAMTAKPLLDIYRAMATVIKKKQFEQGPPDKKEEEMTEDLLKHVGKTFTEMIEKRNSIVHGTWFIGWGNEHTEDFSESPSMKGFVKKDGVEYRSIVSSMSELTNLVQELQDLRVIISRLSVCLSDDRKISRNFHKRDGKWIPESPPS